MMVFDFHPVGEMLYDLWGRHYGDTRGAIVLEIVATRSSDGTRTGEYQFRQHLPHWEGLVGPLLTGVDGLTVKRARDGLNAVILKTCSPWGPLDFLYRLEFLRVPAVAKPGAEYPRYRCEGVVVDTMVVEVAAQEVEVPAGSYRAMVLRSTKHGRKEYWSEEAGLLKIELFREDETPLGYYELAYKNF